MPLFLKALPLSLKTLWRYLFLLPFLTALTIAVTYVAAYIPIIGLIVPGVMSVLCTLAGLRCALNAYGHDSDLDLGKLIRASFWYFVLGIVIGLVATVLVAGLGQVASLTGSGNVGPGSGDGSFGMLEIGVLVLALVGLLFMSAMAVPMTAAAATATVRGSQSDLFWGFGSGTVSIAIVWVLGTIGCALLFFAFHEVVAVFVILQGDVSELTRIFLALPHKEVVIPVMIGSLLFVVWTTCWFFATSVLAWDRTRTQQVAKVRKVVAAPRMSAEDLRALREARMRGERSQ
jgi:hypothetical protein